MAVKWVHFRVDEELYERMRAAAVADRRSISNWAALTLERVLTKAEPERPGQSAT